MIKRFIWRSKQGKSLGVYASCPETLFCPHLILLIKQLWRFDSCPENGYKDREESDVAEVRRTARPKETCRSLSPQPLPF